MSAHYTVRGGDNLSAIARRAGISLLDLVAANPQIADPDLIRAGQKIKIPGKKQSDRARNTAAQRIASGSVSAGSFSVTGQRDSGFLEAGEFFGGPGGGPGAKAQGKSLAQIFEETGTLPGYEATGPNLTGQDPIVNLDSPTILSDQEAALDAAGIPLPEFDTPAAQIAGRSRGAQALAEDAAGIPSGGSRLPPTVERAVRAVTGGPGNDPISGGGRVAGTVDPRGQGIAALSVNQKRVYERRLEQGLPKGVALLEAQQASRVGLEDTAGELGRDLATGESIAEFYGRGYQDTFDVVEQAIERFRGTEAQRTITNARTRASVLGLSGDAAELFIQTETAKGVALLRDEEQGFNVTTASGPEAIDKRINTSPSMITQEEQVFRADNPITPGEKRFNIRNASQSPDVLKLQQDNWDNNVAITASYLISPGIFRGDEMASQVTDGLDFLAALANGEAWAESVLMRTANSGLTPKQNQLLLDLITKLQTDPELLLEFEDVRAGGKQAVIEWLEDDGWKKSAGDIWTNRDVVENGGDSGISSLLFGEANAFGGFGFGSPDFRGGGGGGGRGGGGGGRGSAGSGTQLYQWRISSPRVA